MTEPLPEANWQRLHGDLAAMDPPGFRDAFDEKKKAFRTLATIAETSLRRLAEPLRTTLLMLADSNLQEGTLVWKQAWDHHWCRFFCQAWGIAL